MFISIEKSSLLWTLIFATNVMAADLDQDGTDDNVDNCTTVANPDQRDTNGDGIGNACDADLNNDCIVNTFDLSMLRSAFGQTGASDADLTSDDVVNTFDLTRMRQSFGQTPGPTGLYTPCRARCDGKSWRAGSEEICDGVFVYHDYVYDDFGASDGGPWVIGYYAALAPNDGQVRYDTDLNSADLLNLRLWVDGGDLRVQFEMNTLHNPDSTFAALAVDTDNDAATGAVAGVDGDWEDLCAVEEPHGTGICAVSLSSSGWEELYLFESGDPDTNLIEASIPLPPGDTWRVQAVTGMRDRRVVMNVAFRGEIEGGPGQYDPESIDRTGLWWEREQAHTLSSGDISQFGTVIDVANLQQGVWLPAAPVTGIQQWVYTSDYTIAWDEDADRFRYDQDAEGTDNDHLPPPPHRQLPTQRAYTFFGKHQPYGVYVPETGNAPYGIQLALHGSGYTHGAWLGLPGFRQQFAENLNRILVVPLGRGTTGWYSEASERDVLDVLDDVLANFPTDPEKVTVSGFSMGGYGAYHIGALYPDRFAGFVAWAGSPDSRVIEFDPDHGTNAVDYLRNLREVPGAMLYAGDDPLIFPLFLLEYDALAYESIIYVHPTAEHFTFEELDDFRKEAVWSDGFVRQSNPRQVTFRMQPALWNPDLGLAHDRAYWVRELRGRDTEPGVFVDVDLTTSACGGSLPETTRTDPDPTGDDPTPWTAQEYLVTRQNPITVQPLRIEGRLYNVDSVTIDASDVTGACLAGKTIQYTIETDGRTTISFSTGGDVLELATAGVHVGTHTVAP